MIGLLVFRLDGLRYALPALQVLELVRAVAVTPLPSAPAIVQGVIDVRGEIAAVLDVRGRFGLPPGPVRAADHFVIARSRGRTLALHVDEALDVVTVDEARVQSADRAIQGARYVEGVVQLDDGLVLIHDLDAFLDAAESAALDAALATGTP